VANVHRDRPADSPGAPLGHGGHQLERAQAVVDAINSGGVLPTSTGDSRLVELEEPYATNLKPLNDPRGWTTWSAGH
jgi:hypothetical protein